MNDELAKRFVEVAGAAGVVGDVVSPADAAALVRVANLCNQQGVPITVASGAPDTPGGPPERGGIILSVSKLTGIDVAAPGLTVRAEAGATVAKVRSAVAKEKLAVVGLVPRPDPRSGHASARRRDPAPIPGRGRGGAVDGRCGQGGRGSAQGRRRL